MTIMLLFLFYAFAAFLLSYGLYLRVLGTLDQGIGLSTSKKMYSIIFKWTGFVSLAFLVYKFHSVYFIFCMLIFVVVFIGIVLFAILAKKSPLR